MTQSKILIVPVGLFVLCVSGACSRLQRALQPQHSDQQFEFQRDQQGRLVRLNKVTGEVMLVEGGELRPSRLAASRKRRTAAPIAAAPSGSQAPRKDASRRTAAPASANALEPLDLSIRALGTGGERSLPPGSLLTVVAPTPVFVTPNTNQAPLLEAAQGSTFILVDVEGPWYRVKWNDANSDERQGFIEGKDVGTSTAASQSPVDLSIKPDTTAPVDISIEGAK
jgi:hypothetical protein